MPARRHRAEAPPAMRRSGPSRPRAPTRLCVRSATAPFGGAASAGEVGQRLEVREGDGLGPWLPGHRPAAQFTRQDGAEERRRRRGPAPVPRQRWRLDRRRHWRAPVVPGVAARANPRRRWPLRASGPSRSSTPHRPHAHAVDHRAADSRSACPARGRDGRPSVRSVRFPAPRRPLVSQGAPEHLPRGVPGMMPTRTTWRTCLYVASESATNARAPRRSTGGVGTATARRQPAPPRPLVDQAEHRAVDTQGVRATLPLSPAGATWKPLTLIISFRVREVDPAFGLEPSDVARSDTNRRRRRPLSLRREVTSHHRRAENLDLPDLTGARAHRSRGRPHGVRRPLVATRRSRAAIRRPIDRIGGDDRDLTGPVGGKPPHSGALRDEGGHGFADRSRTPHDVAQRGRSNSSRRGWLAIARAIGATAISESCARPQ